MEHTWRRGEEEEIGVLQPATASQPFLGTSQVQSQAFSNSLKVCSSKPGTRSKDQLNESLIGGGTEGTQGRRAPPEMRFD